MSSSQRAVANLTIETQPQAIIPRPKSSRVLDRQSSRERPSSRAGGGGIVGQRASSANGSRPSSARPYIHEPCSSTLGKFHNGVNHSLMNYSNNGVVTTPGRYSSNTPRSNHPVLEAKQKYKYMTKQKSYVDETLFGNTNANNEQTAYADLYYSLHGQTPRNTSRDYYQQTKNHLSHNLMSNAAPLIVHPPPPGSARPLSSARVDSARKENSDPIDNATGRPGSASQRSTNSRSLPPKPWRP